MLGSTKNIAKKIIKGTWESVFPDVLTTVKTLPRYRPGRILIEEINFSYLDSQAFYWEYTDIFKRKIYQFNTEKKAPFIIDAGGYIGLSVLYFKQLYPNAEVIVFEPDTAIFPILRENLESNKCQAGVTLVNAGVGANDGSILFYPDGADGGTAYLDVKHQQQVQKEIRIMRLSTFINRRVDLLKMNIEGAEAEVFEEIKEFLPLVREIIFEYHAFHNLPQSLGRILTILDECGFKYLVTDATSSKIAIPFTMQENYRAFNLVYAKNSRCA